MAVAGSPSSDLLAPLRAEPDRAGILLDFDGTLAPIVDDPVQARPLDGVVASLHGPRSSLRASSRCSQAGPVDFLVPSLPAELVLSGLYGLEVQRGERRRTTRSPGRGGDVIDDVVAHAARADPRGCWSSPRASRSRFTTGPGPTSPTPSSLGPPRQAARSGSARARRQDVRRAAPADRRRQGHGRRRSRRRPAAVGFVGDDVGDLPAFDALDRFERQVATRCGSRSPAPRPTPPCSSAPTSSSTDPPASVELLLRPSNPASRRQRASWSASQWRGVRSSASARRRSARCRRSSAGMVNAGGARRPCRPRRRGGTASAASPSRSHAPASVTGTSTASRSLTSAPSLATRLSPSRIGFTSSTSARRRAATERG